ncbi:MAG: hypothetical protein U0T36_04230 [Saprospiraceae bacterium]
MVIRFTHLDKEYWTDLSKGIDISIPLVDNASGPKCFYAPDFRVEAVRAGDFIGSTDEGSPVNLKIYLSIRMAMVLIPNVRDILLPSHSPSINV